MRVSDEYCRVRAKSIRAAESAESAAESASESAAAVTATESSVTAAASVRGDLFWIRFRW